MKKNLKIISSLLLVVIAITAGQCSKKAEGTSTCKTCSATGGVDQGTTKKQVCTAEEEQAFRNANSGRTVTCN